MLKIKRNRIIEMMHKQGKTVNEISRELGVSKKTVYNVIKKQVTPSVSFAESIARYFKTDINDIFEFEEE